MIGFKAAVASAWFPFVQMIESRGLINLPTIVYTNITERFNMVFKTCRPMVVLFLLTVHKGQSQVEYNYGNLTFTA